MRAKEYTREKLHEAVIWYISTVYSYSGCACHFRVSVPMFHKLIERAIIEHVASEGECTAITNKAANNCYDYGGEAAARRTEAKYARLRAKRAAYVLPDAEKARLTRFYSCVKDSLEKYAREQYVPRDMLIDAIKCSVKNNLIEDDVYNNWLLPKLASDDTAQQLYQELIQLRQPAQSNSKSVKVEQQLSFLDTKKDT